MIYKAGAPKTLQRHHRLTPSWRRRQVKARQPSMIFGIARVFNWVTPMDITMVAGCTWFLIRRLRGADKDPTANIEEEDDDNDEDDEVAAVNRGNKVFKQLSGANYNFVAQTDEDLAALRTMTCKKCGFSMFIAKDRLKRHFTRGLKCLNCGAKAPDFYNENDPDDPVNKEGATVQSAEGYKPDPVKIAQYKAEMEAAEEEARLAALAEKEAEEDKEDEDEEEDEGDAEAPAPDAVEDSPAPEAVEDEEDDPAAEAVAVAEVPVEAAVEAPAPPPVPVPAPVPKAAPPRDEDVPDIFKELGI